VLQAARVNSGSLYHFFPGKQDLLLAVLDMYHGGLRTMLLEPAWRGVTDPTSCIAAADLSQPLAACRPGCLRRRDEFQVKDGWVPGFKLHMEKVTPAKLKEPKDSRPSRSPRLPAGARLSAGRRHTGRRTSVLLPNSDSMRSTASTAVLLCTSNAG